MVPFITNYPAVFPPFQGGTRIPTTVPRIITYLPMISSFGDRTPLTFILHPIMVVDSTFMNVIDPPIRVGMRYQTTIPNTITTLRSTV
jgi:hypothetical protein